AFNGCDRIENSPLSAAADASYIGKTADGTPGKSDDKNKHKARQSNSLIWPIQASHATQITKRSQDADLNASCSTNELNEIRKRPTYSRPPWSNSRWKKHHQEENVQATTFCMVCNNSSMPTGLRK